MYSLPMTASFFESSPISAPAMKALSPDPVRMATRMSRSDLISLKAVSSSPMVAMFRALSFAGRVMVT